MLRVLRTLLVLCLARELAGSNTGPASQPTVVQASNGGFIPGEGAASGESGELIYYKTY